MEILPYVEGWQPGAPVCTGEQFDGIMAAAGKAAALPGFGHTAYFLAQSATDPAEKGRRWQAILSARMRYSTADHDPEMEQAIAKDHNAILAITAGEMRQDALEEMLAIVPQTAEGTPAGPILKPLSRVEPGKAQYLLHPYLPQGMLSIMGGVSGVGKTWLVLSWAAAITRGARLPFLSPFDDAPAVGNVFYFTCENDPNCVIRPRFDMLGGDPSKMFLFDDDAAGEPLTMNDPRLEEAAARYPPAMVIFDPIQSYLGAGVEMNKANEVRPVLDWLGSFAKRHNCAVVLVSHMSKPGVGNSAALDRLLGSSDFRNAARSIVVVGSDPEDKEIRVFAHAKNSVGTPGESQKYHIESGKGVVYDGMCELTADDIVRQGQPGARAKPAVTLTEARKQLEELLGPEGFATLEQVESLQVLCGISQRTFYNAKKELALQTVSIGQPPNRKTWWLLPEVDATKFKQEHTPPPEQMNFAKLPAN